MEKRMQTNISGAREIQRLHSHPFSEKNYLTYYLARKGWRQMIYLPLEKLRGHELFPRIRNKRLVPKNDVNMLLYRNVIGKNNWTRIILKG